MPFKRLHKGYAGRVSGMVVWVHPSINAIKTLAKLSKLTFSEL